MYAILYRTGGKDRLVVGECDPDSIDSEVVASIETASGPGDVFDLLSEREIDDTPAPTIEQVTDAFDPWLAWYGGDDDGSYVVLYGRRDADDRKVGFSARDGGYEVRLQFGTVLSAADHEFEPNDHAPVVVTSRSRLYAKRVFYDLCDVS